MAKRIREISELIGKVVEVHQKILIPRAQHHRYAWFQSESCKVVDYRLTRSGDLAAIYVVKAIDRSRKKWRKTRIRIPASLLNHPTRRRRIEILERMPDMESRYYRSCTPPRFRWAWEHLSLFSIGKYPDDPSRWGSIAPMVVMRRGQRGTNSKEWRREGPTVAAWLNNDDLIEQPVEKRHDPY